MIRLISIPLVATALLLACFGATTAQQSVQEQPEPSDYEIYQSFTQAWSELQGRLDLVGSPAAADSLIAEISDLEDRFSGHRELLDEALHPRSYRAMMDRLRSRAVDTRARLAEIASLNNRIERMNRQLTSYDEQLQSLTGHADSLQQAMRSTAVEKRDLQELAAEYRRSVERRDALVRSIVDSMTVTYADLPAAQEEQLSQGGSLSGDGGPLDLIERVAARNAAFLEESADLQVMDYLRMNQVHREFSAMWNRLDEQLLSTYGEGEERRDRIQEQLTRWGERLDTQLWMAVNRDLQELNLPVAEVNGSGELFKEMDSYLDRSLERATEEGGEEVRNDWQRFNNFWTGKVQLSWAEYAGDQGFLTHRQIAELDEKVDRWALRAQPESNLFAWLFGVSMLLWLLTGLLIVRRSGGDGETQTRKGRADYSDTDTSEGAAEDIGLNR
ncbi:MAG: hypothetical protein U5K31_14375 [Balneolaceae bacterium]|nr:hypothetical protein [Balneolaceae bacterium]